MNRLKWIITGLGVVAMATSNPLLGIATPAQTERPSLRQTLSEFFNRDVEDRNRGQRGGSRDPRQNNSLGDGNICVLNPGSREKIWHRQPLFVFQGDVEKIAVRPVGGTTDIWSAPATPTASNHFQVAFDGQPLQPGMRYEWLFYQRQQDQTVPIVFRLPFQVMAAGTEREQIATALKQLQTQLERQGADAKTIVQAKATFFLEKNLPADAMQAIFSLESPSEELAAFHTETVDEICSQLLMP